jgi:hypothetical protein
MTRAKLMERTCQQCGKVFRTKWVTKRFCSDKCRYNAQNIRLGKVDPHEERTKIPKLERPFIWIACNEITYKLCYVGTDTAIGWVMDVEDKGWFGRVRNEERGEFSFGPSSRKRCQKAAEAWLNHEPFEKQQGEKTWSGDAWDIVQGL